MEHKKKKDLICLKDNKLICYDCALFGNHKNHEFKKLENFEKEIKLQIEDFYNDFLELDDRKVLKENFLEDFKNQIEKKKMYFFSILEENVKIIKENLDKRKFEIEDDIEKEFFKIRNNLITFENDAKKVKLENDDLIAKIEEIKGMNFTLAFFEGFNLNLQKIQNDHKNIKLKIKKLNLGSKLLLKDDLRAIDEKIGIETIKKNLLKSKKNKKKISSIHKLKRKTSKFSNHSRNLTDIKLIRFENQFKNNLLSSYSEENLEELKDEEFLEFDLFSNNDFKLNSDISSENKEIEISENSEIFMNSKKKEDFENLKKENDFSNLRKKNDFTNFRRESEFMDFRRDSELLKFGKDGDFTDFRKDSDFEISKNKHFTKNSGNFCLENKNQDFENSKNYFGLGNMKDDNKKSKSNFGLRNSNNNFGSENFKITRKNNSVKNENQSFIPSSSSKNQFVNNSRKKRINTNLFYYQNSASVNNSPKKKNIPNSVLKSDFFFNPNKNMKRRLTGYKKNFTNIVNSKNMTNSTNFPNFLNLGESQNINFKEKKILNKNSDNKSILNFRGSILNEVNIRKFIEKKNRKTIDISFCNQNINSRKLEQILKNLVINKNSKNLIFNKNNINSEGFIYLIKFIRKNRNFEKIYLKNNKIDIKGLKFLFKNSKFLNRVYYLNLEGNNIVKNIYSEKYIKDLKDKGINIII